MMLACDICDIRDVEILESISTGTNPGAYEPSSGGQYPLYLHLSYVVWGQITSILFDPLLSILTWYLNASPSVISAGLFMVVQKKGTLKTRWVNLYLY